MERERTPGTDVKERSGKGKEKRKSTCKQTTKNIIQRRSYARKRRNWKQEGGRSKRDYKVFETSKGIEKERKGNWEGTDYSCARRASRRLAVLDVEQRELRDWERRCRDWVE